MRVCVTGASGFIGQHVTKALLGAGHEVIALDVYEPPYGSWAKADIRLPLAPIPGLDAVIHLAAIAAPRECDSDPARAFSVNVGGTSNVLKMALESGAKKVVFSSTAHVYGVSPKYMPTAETHILHLQDTYTVTKILGEQLCHLYFENQGLSYTVLRLFNTYGPGQRPGYYIPDQINKAKRGKVSLQGSNVTKDWVYVGDVARAFVQAIGTDFVGAVNIGSGAQTDLGTIAERICDPFKAELVCIPSDNPTHMQADIRRAQRVLGWYPAVDLEHGIRDVLDVAMGTVAPVA